MPIYYILRFPPHLPFLILSQISGLSVISFNQRKIKKFTLPKKMIKMRKKNKIMKILLGLGMSHPRYGIMNWGEIHKLSSSCPPEPIQVIENGIVYKGH